MNVLVLNSGSSSLKCQLFTMPAETVAAKAVVERVGGEARLTLHRGGATTTATRQVPDHRAAIAWVLAELGDLAAGVDAVGHRVVHAGEAFTGSVPVTPAVMAALDACSDLAPLHNPANLAGIRACLAALPGVPQAAVFDNALHHTLEPADYLYGLPRAFHAEHRIRRYGFHGVAFRSMVAEVERVLGRPAADLRIVSLMLGSGCTANALCYGASVAISTGFTPLEGLVQSTRCGDLDPGAVLALLRAGYAPDELNRLLNRESGLLGLSGVSADLRDILNQAGAGASNPAGAAAAAGVDYPAAIGETVACSVNDAAANTSGVNTPSAPPRSGGPQSPLAASSNPAARAALALDVFLHRAVQYVGAYAAQMGGLEVLALGGGIGQHAAAVRARLCRPLEHLGVRLDADRNAFVVGAARGLISADDSPVAVVVAAVDEELVIARDTCTVLA